MKMRKHVAGGRKVFWRCLALGLSVITLAFAACGRPATDPHNQPCRHQGP